MSTNDQNTPDLPLSPLGRQTYTATSGGALGLLALGYRGIDAWRKKREEQKKNPSGTEKK